MSTHSLDPVPVNAGGSGSTVLSGFPSVSFLEADRQRVSTDRSGFVPESLPDGVVLARTADDVVATLQLATEHRIPVVPRGAGTGLAAASSSRAGELVLDVSGMNRILRIEKNKEGTCPQILLSFDGRHQTFAPAKRDKDLLSKYVAEGKKARRQSRQPEMEQFSIISGDDPQMPF